MKEFKFQSLKGFGGLWNCLGKSDGLVRFLFQSLKGFGGLWNRQNFRDRIPSAGFNP